MAVLDNLVVGAVTFTTYHLIFFKYYQLPRWGQLIKIVIKFLVIQDGVGIKKELHLLKKNISWKIVPILLEVKNRRKMTEGCIMLHSGPHPLATQTIIYTSEFDLSFSTLIQRFR